MRHIGIICILFVFVSCDIFAPPEEEPTITAVTVIPTEAQLFVGDTLQFTAIIEGTDDFDSTVTWRVNGRTGGNERYGTISSEGLYIAPIEIPLNSQVTVKAVSADDPTKSGSAVVTIGLPVWTLEERYHIGDVGVDSDGNIYVCGAFYRDQDKTDIDFFAAKFGTEGQIEWLTEIIADVVLSTPISINIVVAGASVYVSAFHDAPASFDKLDAHNGNIVWNVQTPNARFSRSSAIDRYNNIYILGFHQLIKLDENGSVVNTLALGNFSVGYIKNVGDTLFLAGYYGEPLIAKCNLEPNWVGLLYVNRVPEGTPFPQGLIGPRWLMSFDASPETGLLYLTSTYENFPTVFAYDAVSGSLQWHLQFGDPIREQYIAWEQMQSVALDDDGNLYILGQQLSPNPERLHWEWVKVTPNGVIALTTPLEEELIGDVNYGRTIVPWAPKIAVSSATSTIAVCNGLNKVLRFDAITGRRMH